MAISNPSDIGTVFLGTASTTIALTTTNTVSAGGKIFVFIGWYHATATISSVADGTNPYTIDTQGNSGNTGFGIASADCPAGLASGATITVTFSASVNDRTVAAAFSTGVQTGNVAYGAAGQAQNANSNWDSTSTTTTVATGDLAIGGSHWENGVTATSTPTGGNTELHDGVGASGTEMTTVYQFGAGAVIGATGTWSTASGGIPSGTRSHVVAYPASTASVTNAPEVYRVVRSNQRW